MSVEVSYEEILVSIINDTEMNITPTRIIGTDNVTAKEIIKFLDKTRKSLKARASSEQWLTVVNKIWLLVNKLEACNVSDEVIETIPPDLSEFISDQWYQFVNKLEADLAAEYIRGENSKPPFKNMDYHRERIFSLVPEFNRGGKLVFVGCGLLPTTLMWAFNQHGLASSLVGLDRCANNINTARTVFMRCRGPAEDRHVMFETAEANQFIYDDVSIVHINNAVRGKSDILKRIAETSPPDTVVLFQEPADLLRLVAERLIDENDGCPELPSEFKMIAPPVRFSSYNAYALRRNF